MSDDRLRWTTLVEKAKREATPTIDVADRVARRIVDRASLPSSDWPIWAATGLSVAAALLMTVAVQLLGVSLSDPFGDWMSSFFLVMS